MPPKCSLNGPLNAPYIHPKFTLKFPKVPLNSPEIEFDCYSPGFGFCPKMGLVGFTKISPVQHHKISSISIKDKVINDIIKNGPINNDELNVKSSQFDNSSNHCLSDNCLTFENKLFYFFEKMILLI